MLITSNYLIKAFRKVGPLRYPGILILCTYVCLNGKISSAAVLYLENLPAKEKQQNKNKVMHKEKAAVVFGSIGWLQDNCISKTACSIQYVLSKLTLLITIRKWGANKEKLISKLLKPRSLVLGSYSWFSQRLRAAGVTALPDHSANTGSSCPVWDKGAISPLKSAGFRKRYASCRAEKNEKSRPQEMSANRPHVLCKRGNSWLQGKKK